MTGEQLHDALTLLPAELVAEADWRRQHPKPRIVYWGRFGSLAACAALVLGCLWLVNGMFHTGAKSTESMLTNEAAAQAQGWGEEKETDTADAAVPEEAPAENSSREIYPGIALLGVAEAPSAGDFSTVRVISHAEALPVALDLPEGWFDSHDILAFRFAGCPEEPGLLSVRKELDQWFFTFRDLDGAGEGKAWYLLLETEKGLVAEEQVNVCFESHSG